MTVDPIARRTAQRVLKVWHECDPVAEAAATQLHATCTKGCAACCHLLVLMPLAEAITIALYVFTHWQPQDGLALVLRCQEQLSVYGDKVTIDAHFKKQIPCVFLGDDKLCRVYEVRPTSCRYHTAVSPPANCSLGAADPIVASINLNKLRGYVLDVIMKMKEVGGIDLTGPLPIMMYTALTVLLDTRRTLIEHMPTVQNLSAIQLLSWLDVEPDNAEEAANIVERIRALKERL
jgi:Fe-S-cluster containining protein